MLEEPARGAVAQLGERLNGIQEVGGSIPLGSTKFFKGLGHKRTGVGPRGLVIFTQDSGTGSTPSAPYCSALVARGSWRATTTD